MGDEIINVIVKSDVLEKIRSGLSEIKLTSKEEEIKNKADKLLNLLNNKGNSEDKEDNYLTVEDTIYNKMKSTNDKDLNVKLYMLYRKLQDNKISEQEALRLYEIYVESEYDDTMIY